MCKGFPFLFLVTIIFLKSPNSGRKQLYLKGNLGCSKHGTEYIDGVVNLRHWTTQQSPGWDNRHSHSFCFITEMGRATNWKQSGEHSVLVWLIRFYESCALWVKLYCLTPRTQRMSYSQLNILTFFQSWCLLPFWNYASHKRAMMTTIKKKGSGGFVCSHKQIALFAFILGLDLKY